MNASSVYRDHLLNILKTGKEVTVRGQETIESIGARTQTWLVDPVVRNEGRRVSYQLMMDEAQWILAGSNNRHFSPAIARFWFPYSDDGDTLAGAYGPPFINQMHYVADCLNRDPFSRQAVMNIWNNCPKPSKNIPCTVNLQWLIRGGLINCIATMRSSDAWKGWPYDVFTFSMMTHQIRLLLNFTPLLGNLIINMGSAHLYGPDIEKAKLMVVHEPPSSRAFPYHLAGCRDSFNALLNNRELVTGLKKTHNDTQNNIPQPISDESIT